MSLDVGFTLTLILHLRKTYPFRDMRFVHFFGNTNFIKILHKFLQLGFKNL